MKTFITYWLPVILWAGVIFYASSQPYKEQDLRPFLSEQFPLEWVDTYFGWVSFDYAGEEVSAEHIGEASFVEFFIRKGAHLTVYLILSLLLYRALLFTTSIRYTKTIAILLAILYAASDEFHQSFTTGRSPHVEDVILDSLGVLVAVIIGKIVVRKK